MKKKIGILNTDNGTKTLYRVDKNYIFDNNFQNWDGEAYIYEDNRKFYVALNDRIIGTTNKDYDSIVPFTIPKIIDRSKVKYRKKVIEEVKVENKKKNNESPQNSRSRSVDEWLSYGMRVSVEDLIGKENMI